MRAGSRIATLAILAVVTAAVFAMPTTAVAEKTTLCAQDSETCVENVETHIHLESIEHALLLSSFATVQCEALFLGDTLGEGFGNPLIIHGNLTYTCLNECTATEENGPSEIKVLKTGTELAKVTGEGLVHVVCGLNCRYNGVGLEAHALGPLIAGNEAGEVTIEEQVVNKESGFFCPSTSKLDIQLEPLQALYIRSTGSLLPPLSLCSKDEGSPVCKSENQLKSIDYKDKAVEILTNLINVKCEGLASGTVGTPESGKPLEVKPELTYSGCSEGCFVTSVAGPGKIMLERSKSEEATATSEGFEIFVKCGTTIKCLLGPEKMTGKALGALTTGDNGHLTFTKVSMGKGEGATCPKEATLDALYVASSAAYIG